MAKINYPKSFPHFEIYAALTHLINDPTEILIDKYNRQGRLVNIGEYYLFQPDEINNTSSSIFDRSVPVDYKPQYINLVPGKISKKERPEITLDKVISEDEIIKQTDNTNVYEKEKEINDISTLTRGKSIKDKIVKDILTVDTYFVKDKVERSDTDYYKHMGLALKKMENILKIDKTIIEPFIVHHAIDILPYEDKVSLLNFVYSIKKIDEGDKIFIMKTYFDKFIVVYKYLTSIVFYDHKKRHILVLDKRTNIWKDADPEDERDLSKSITEKYTVNTEKFNKYIGLIADGPRDENLLFKVKDSTNKRSHGTTCEQATKSKNIDILNKLLGSDIFNKDNVKPLFDMGICCIQEMIMRLFNIQKPNKIWFVDPDTAKMYNL